MAHPSPRRALALAALSLAVLPAMAQANVTRSTVTSPANPTYRLYELERTLAAPKLTVVATTDGEAAEKVDVLCTFGADYELLAKDQTVSDDGTLEVDVALYEFPTPQCDLRVVPAGFRGPDYAPFTGPAVAASGYVPASYSAPVRGTKRFATLDYSVGSGNQRAAASIASAGGGGLFAAEGVKAAAHELFGYPTWRDGAAVNALRVDGRTAYTAADIPLFSFGAETASTPAGFEGLQSNVALDPATGALTVSESQRIFRCDRTDDERPEEEDCASVLDTGIRHERTITLTRQHSVADVRDRWISSDGRPHQIVAQYSVMSQEAKSEAPEWRFPGDTAFRPQAEIDLMPTGPGTALVRDGAGLRAPGALSYTPAPERFRFAREVVVDGVVLAVPAGGVAPVRRVFAIGRDLEEAAALGRATEDGFDAPRVVISSPSDGLTTAAASATVSGRATDNIGVAALAVNGRRVTVAADGSFSAPVALARGSNEITVAASDGSGLAATARVVVQRAVAERCRVPKVKPGARVRAARAALRKAGCTARRRTGRVRSRTVRKGRVVRLSRKPGTVLPLGAAVGIRVSAGKRR